MGFGGSRFTKDYALKMLIYAVSVGAKLFVMQLLVGLAQQIFTQLNGSFTGDANDIFIAVGTGLVMLVLVKNIPETIQALLNGVSTGGAGMGVLSGAVGTAAGAVLGAGRGVASGVHGGEQPPTSSPARRWRPAAVPGHGRAQIARNLAGAARDTVGGRLSGRQHFGTFGGQMADNLEAKTPTAPPKEK